MATICKKCGFVVPDRGTHVCGKKTTPKEVFTGYWAVTRGGQVEVDERGRLEVYISKTIAENRKLSWQEVRPVAVQIRSR